MNDAPSPLVNCWPYWPNIAFPIRSRGVPLIIALIFIISKVLGG